MTCAYVPTDAAFLSGMLDYIDCQAQTIGEQGYLALAAPGSIASLILTALLTILIALFGYRMLLGQTPQISDTILTFVKVGIVVALATGWSGYRTLFYDTTLHGPAELASAIGTPAGLPGSSGGLGARLDGVDQQFQALSVAVATRSRPVLYQQQFAAPPLFQGFDTFALGAARVTFLIGAMSALAVVRLIAGLLLALGPLFIAFLLFDGTRGLFEGWLRVLTGAALGALAATIALGTELALLEPWLADLVARTLGGDDIPGVPAQLLAVSLVFGIVLVAMVGAAVRVAWALGLSDLRTRVVDRSNPAIDRDRAAGMMTAGSLPRLASDRPRAVAVADAIMATERRETAASAPRSWASAGPGAGGGRVAQLPDAAASSALPSGASGRRTSTRVSASAGRRDRMR